MCADPSTLFVPWPVVLYLLIGVLLVADFPKMASAANWELHLHLHKWPAILVMLLIMLFVLLYPLVVAAALYRTRQRH